MRVTPLFIVSALVLASQPTRAENDQVLKGPAPGWVKPSEMLPVPQNVSGPAFVRRQDILVHLDQRGQAQYIGSRIKILQPSGLQLGNISIPWNPAAGAPTMHTVKVYRDGATIDILPTAKFEILRREDQLEAARLDGTLTGVLRVPDLRVGDELEVELTTRVSDPTLGNNGAGLLFLAPNPSPGRFRLALSWDETRKPSIKLTEDLVEKREDQARAMEIRFDNPPPTTPPKDAPPRFQWQRIVEFSDFADWPAISRHFAPLFGKASAIAKSSPVKAEAARIAATHVQPLDRARAALKLVQQDVRYIYVGLNGGNLAPASADETWERRYGDCKGKTTLLMALLSELGIASEAVLVNSTGTDDGLDQRLPNPGMFDHVLVRMRLDGVTYWLDGTLPPVVPPSTKPVFPANWVLPLTDKGSSIERLDWQPATTPDEVVLFEIDAREGFDKPARIKNTTIKRGIEGLQQQVQFSALSSDQLLSAFRQEMIGDTWQEIDDVQWRYDQGAQASILTIAGTGMVDWEDQGDREKSLVLPGGGFNPPDKRVRPAGQRQDLPYLNKPEFECRVTTVRLPTSTRPPQWTSNASFDTRLFGRNYYRAFDLRDGAFRMVRGLRTEQREIDATAAQCDNSKIAAFDNSMAVISYNPAGQNSLAVKGKTVPATYEFDWTAKDVPCIAPGERM